MSDEREWCDLWRDIVWYGVLYGVAWLGLAGLLEGMGDHAGGRFCVRVAIGLGVGWACSLVTTTVTAGITILERPDKTSDKEG